VVGPMMMAGCRCVWKSAGLNSCTVVLPAVVVRWLFVLIAVVCGSALGELLEAGWGGLSHVGRTLM